MALVLLVSASLNAGSASAAGASSYIAEIMPPAACLAAPERACLLKAYENVVSRYENREESTKAGWLRLSMEVGHGLDDPGVDALITRYNPRLTADRLKAERAQLGPFAANPSARFEKNVIAPSPSALPAEQSRILAITDRSERMWRTNEVITALAKSGRFAEAESLLAVIQKSLRGKDDLANSMAVTAARSFGDVGEWPSWSRALAAGGYVKKMAAARTTSAPEDDPTEFAILEPLRHGIAVKDLLPWVARTKDPAFRDELLTQIADAVFERGRVAAWRSDLAGFRRYVVAATAKGELLAHPDYPSSGSDPTLLAFCYGEDKQRGDRVLALVAALQNVIGPLSDENPPGRDSQRERVLSVLAHAMLIAER